MTIKQAADQLQELINEEMKLFTTLGKQAKELSKKLTQTHLKMGKILTNLEPVDALIRAQHPEKVQLFDALIEEARKHNEG